MRTLSYAGYRFPSEVIQRAVWMCLRFSLSFRDVEEMLAERGIVFTYESIRRWMLAFGPAITRRIRAQRPKPHRQWHLDKVFVRIGGRQMYLWRAVDAEGEVLDVLVQAKRDTRAAMKLMRKLLKIQGMVPEAWVTDWASSKQADILVAIASRPKATAWNCNGLAHRPNGPKRAKTAYTPLM